MKKIKFLLFILLIIIITGCNTNTKTTNEIYNKTYNVTVDIAEFENLIVAVGEKCSSGTIGITNYQTNGFTLYVYGTGSGFIYDGVAVLKDESIVSLDEVANQEVKEFRYKAITNYHVVENNVAIKAYFGPNYKEELCDVIAYDKNKDIALISFTSSLYLQPLELGDSDNVKKGQFAIAIGSPTGFEFFNSLTLGVVSYQSRLITDEYGSNLYIQTDVAINPGNSGGPLLNIHGEVIGVNTMKFVDEEIDSMGFSIPINVIKVFIQKNDK